MEKQTGPACESKGTQKKDIKNCQYEVYLAASSGQIGTVVGTSKTPTIWNFIRTHAGFAIQYGEEDSVIDLHYGADQVENIISLWKSDGLPDARRWRFERMSDDTGGEEADVVEEEVDCLRRELAEKMEQLVLKDQEIARKDQRLAEQAALRESSQDLDKRLAELHEKIEELQQLSKVSNTSFDIKAA
ncbi:hypothetical protein FRC06_003506 [Ceratobasidium sp. 370]|nr:hypothetical protein FRC06_003506 [Ceratobasidium sp. 370]